MSTSITEMIEALDAAESILRYMPNTSTNCNGTKPPMTTHKALQLVRHALKQAEMQRSSHVES